MKLYVARHARAVSKEEWPGVDALRPLNDKGRIEAERLAQALQELEPPTRIVCAPPLRCQESVAPFAARCGVEVDPDDRLSRGEPLQRVLELFPRPDEGPALLCTHADIIGDLLDFLELRIEDVGGPSCRKGAFWVLDGSGAAPTSAHYVEPTRMRHSDGKATRPSVRAAALDLGSTSFNLLIADVTAEGDITPLIRQKVMLRLGAVIAGGGRIPREVAQVATETARDLHAIAKQEKVSHLLPVATAALRDARNGRKVADAIGKALETPVRILSGRDEAHAIFRAFSRRLDLSGTPMLGLDLGGGSLEIALGQDEAVAHDTSLKLGVARLHSEFVDDDPMRSANAKAIRARVREELAPFRKCLHNHTQALRAVTTGGAVRAVTTGGAVHAATTGGAVHAVATGGTVRALARLVHEKSTGGPAAEGRAIALTLEDLVALESRLVPSSHEERRTIRGMKKARADLVPTGAIILRTVFEELRLDRVSVCDWGLREGILLGALDQGFRT